MLWATERAESFTIRCPEGFVAGAINQSRVQSVELYRESRVSLDGAWLSVEFPPLHFEACSFIAPSRGVEIARGVQGPAWRGPERPGEARRSPEKPGEADRERPAEGDRR